MASRDPITRALDVLFAGAADLRVLAADMRPMTPAEFQRQRDLLALAARIRTDVARIGNERHDGTHGVPGENAMAFPAVIAKAA